MKITLALVVLTLIIVLFAFISLGSSVYWPTFLAMGMSVIIFVSWFIESRFSTPHSN